MTFRIRGLKNRTASVAHAGITGSLVSIFAGTLKQLGSLSIAPRGHMTESSSFSYQTSVPVTPGYFNTGAVIPNDGESSSARLYSGQHVRRGVLIEWAGHNHGTDLNNGVRYFNPVTNQTGYLWPWTQTVSPPTLNGGINTYSKTYDNEFEIYIPSDDVLVHGVYAAANRGGGVFDFASNSWIHGNADPFLAGQDVQRFFEMDATTYAILFGISQQGVTWNGIQFWCPALDCGIHIGGSIDSDGEHTLIIHRNPAYPSTSTKPWKINSYRFASASQPANVALNILGGGLGHCRHNAAVVGTKVFIGGGTRGSWWVPLNQNGSKKRQMDCWLLDLTPCATGGMWTVSRHYPNALPDKANPDVQNGPGQYAYPQYVYDEARNRVLVLSRGVFSWDLTTEGPFVEITPAGWGWTQNPTYQGGWIGALGFYRADHDAIYMRGGVPLNADMTAYPDSSTFNTVEAARVYRYQFSNAPSRYRTITVGQTPFPAQQTKHVHLVWHPTLKRVYSWGGDYGPGDMAFFGQPYGNVVVPGSGRTVFFDQALRNDQYSIDPYGSGTVDWRLEHPFFPRDLGGGVREERPGRPDQTSLVWDETRNKFWGFHHVIRSEFLNVGDELIDASTVDYWATGSMTAPPVEPDATWSFTPNASGSAGTWVKETTNRLTYRSGQPTSYNGGQLITGYGEDRIYGWCRDTKRDRFHVSGHSGTNSAFYTFNPNTLTYEYRTLGMPSGYTYFSGSSSPHVMVDDWIYFIAYGRTAGLRKSLLCRLHVPSVLAVANTGAVTLNSTIFQLIDLPFSLMQDATWERINYINATISEHAGVMAIDRKVVVAGTLSGLLQQYDAHTEAPIIIASDQFTLSGNQVSYAGLNTAVRLFFYDGGAHNTVDAIVRSIAYDSGQNKTIFTLASIQDHYSPEISKTLTGGIGQTGTALSKPLTQPITNIGVYSPDEQRWLYVQPATQQQYGSSWVALPDTGEILFGLSTRNGSSENLYAYRVR